MDFPVRIAAVIPCHNEAATIFSLVREVGEFVSTVIVVDDGSSDATSRLAVDAGAIILRHEIPQGKGAALKAGWKRAQELNHDWVITLDGDGQHAPKDIPKFLAVKEQAPLVIGDRMHSPEAMPWLRRFVNRWMSARLSKFSGRQLTDTQCGFRLIDLKKLSALSLETDHFEIESETLLAFLEAGHAVEFVPIEVIYKKERSKIRPIPDTIRWFRWSWNTMRLHKRRRFPVLPRPSPILPRPLP